MNKYIACTTLANYDNQQTETGRQRQRAESEQGTRRMHDTADERARPKPEEEVKTITVHNPSNLPTIDFHKLQLFQGDLKTLREDSERKLCQSIIDNGFFVPAFVWCSESILWVLDATQRISALYALEKKNFAIPPIPYVLIDAKNKQDAAKKLLQITSQYGKINPKTTFLTDFKLDLSFIKQVEIPEFNIALNHDDFWKVGKPSVRHTVELIHNEKEALALSKEAINIFCDISTVLIAFSGGLDSTFAMYWAKQNFPDKQIIAVFSDTGVEFPCMTSHVTSCCKYLDVECKLVKPEKDMWVEIERYKSFPSTIMPWCQKNFIYRPVNKFFKTFGKKDVVIIDGSSAKQSTRLSDKTKTSAAKDPYVNGYTFYHPAFDIGRETIMSTLKKAEVPLWDGYSQGFVRTACWMCPSQCGEQAYALDTNYPGLANVIRHWEKKISHSLRFMNNIYFDEMVAIGKRKVAKRAAK